MPTPNCLAEETLLAFAGGHVEGPKVDEIERHIDGCSTCRKLVAALGATASAHTPPVSESPRDVARTIGRYQIIALVGVGGMGLVYSALDPQLQRRVALKLLRSDLGSQDHGAATRIIREAQAMARVAHPNVIHVYDVGEVHGEVFIAMEFVDGQTLGEATAKARSWRDILRLYVEAGAGLQAAHEAGIIHRDFKPDNVLVGKDGRPRVSDFGIARAGDAHAAGEARVGAAIDKTSAIAGTPAYMPPEQMRGARVDARADIFSFSVALYEALYGQRPFGGASVPELLATIDTGRVTPPPPSSRVPRWVYRCLVRGLRPLPEERFPTMTAMLQALQAPTRAWRRAAALSAVGAGVVAAVVAGLAARAPTESRGTTAAEASRAPEAPPPASRPAPKAAPEPPATSIAEAPAAVSVPPAASRVAIREQRAQTPAARPTHAVPASPPSAPPAASSVTPPAALSPPPAQNPKPIDLFNEPR